MNSLKALTVLFWVVFIVNLFQLLPNYYVWLTYAGFGLLVIHGLEYVMIKPKKFKDMSLIQTLLFGFGYWLPILKSRQ